MKRHVTFELEASDLDALVEGHPLDLNVDDADSVSIGTNAYPKLMDSAGGFQFVDEPHPVVTDGGEELEATDQDVAENVGVVSTSDLESRDVTLEQVLTRDGDEETVMWVASIDTVDANLGGETPAEALRTLADVLETRGGDA